MKTSWFIGIFMLYVCMQILITIIDGGSGVSGSDVAALQGMLQPAGTDVTPLQGVPVIGSAVSLITNVWSYTKPVIESIFLYSPTLFSGTWLWVYFVFFLPVAIAMIISIVFVMRGVQSS